MTIIKIVSVETLSENIMKILFPILGLILTSYGLLKKINIIRFEKLWLFINSKNSLLYVIASIFIIFGILMVISTLYSNYKGKKNYILFFVGIISIIGGLIPIVFMNFFLGWIAN